MTNEHHSATVMGQNTVPSDSMASNSFSQCPLTLEAQLLLILAVLAAMAATCDWVWLSLIANRRWTDFVHGKESCTFEVEWHQMRCLRVMAVEGTVCGATETAMNREHRSWRLAFHGGVWYYSNIPKSFLLCSSSCEYFTFKITLETVPKVRPQNLQSLDIRYT